MRKIFKIITTGVINGFPVLRSVNNAIKEARGVKTDIPLSADSLKSERFIFALKSLVVEISIVGLIFSFVFGKITKEDLLQFIGLI